MKSRKPNVVLLEDNDIDFEILQEVIASLDINLNLVRFGRLGKFFDAVNSNELPSFVSLFICDLRLPDGNGREAIELLREVPTYRNTPIVILSTSSNPRDIDDCYAARANAFHCKLTELDQFSLQIKKMLEYWLHEVVIRE